MHTTDVIRTYEMRHIVWLGEDGREVSRWTNQDRETALRTVARASRPGRVERVLFDQRIKARYLHLYAGDFVHERAACDCADPATCPGE